MSHKVKYKCDTCGGRSYDVHENTYGQTILVCQTEKCHSNEKFTFNEDESWSEAPQKAVTPAVVEPIYKECYGYKQVGEDETEPTNRQTDLQDRVDNAIQYMVETIVIQYEAGAENVNADVSWDIGKITEIRQLVERLYGLPEVY